MIDKYIEMYDEISIEDSKKVEFLRRCDTKYVLSRTDLESLMNNIKNEYFVMSVMGVKLQEYQTVYFDTDDNYFYFSHYNGKNNRIKIRKRQYLCSGLRYMEVKKKSLSGYSTKKRFKTDASANTTITDHENKFIYKHTSFQKDDIRPVVMTQFKRITLVNKNFTERVTIDLDLSFRDMENKECSFCNLIIVEVKRNKHEGKTPIQLALRMLNIPPNSFTKYCVGRVLLDENLKKNKFKRTLSKILCKRKNLSRC